MSDILKNKHLAITDGKDFSLKHHKTSYKHRDIPENELEEKLNMLTLSNSELQEKLYARHTHAILIILQAMDAAGKDSTIEHVMKGINPQGCDVTSFKTPAGEELEHDFLWRPNRALPVKGKMGIFNRSYYEEVLVVKVHPAFVVSQNLPGISDIKHIDKTFWKKRYEAIRNYEENLTQNGTIILKFFLNVSKKEQKNRFIARIDDPSKNWKFNYNDMKERAHWDSYMKAYETAIRETATPSAPWYVIPADDKKYMRYCVSKILNSTLEQLNLEFPEVSPENKKLLLKAKKELLGER